MLDRPLEVALGLQRKPEVAVGLGVVRGDLESPLVGGDGLRDVTVRPVRVAQGVVDLGVFGIDLDGRPVGGDRALVISACRPGVAEVVEGRSKARINLGGLLVSRDASSRRPCARWTVPML